MNNEFQFSDLRPGMLIDVNNTIAILSKVDKTSNFMARQFFRTNDGCYIGKSLFLVTPEIYSCLNIQLVSLDDVELSPVPWKNQPVQISLDKDEALMLGLNGDSSKEEIVEAIHNAIIEACDNKFEKFNNGKTPRSK